jgi:hypothetical protein
MLIPRPCTTYRYRDPGSAAPDIAYASESVLRLQLRHEFSTLKLVEGHTHAVHEFWFSTLKLVEGHTHAVQERFLVMRTQS